MRVPVLRIARATNDLQNISLMYQHGLNLAQLGSFTAHDGFDGVMLGHPQSPWHLEFTQHDGDVAPDCPSSEQLLVLYIPEKADWERRCEEMIKAGFTQVASGNPYWNTSGKTFEDPEKYRVVIQNAAWNY